MIERDFGILAAVFILVLVMVVPVSAANSIVLNEGNSQTTTVGTAVATSPSVKVVNGSIPVSGVEITFATTDGSVTDATQTTGADGIATVGSWVLGTTAGSNTLTATGAGLTGSPVTFSATGTAGPATQIIKNNEVASSYPVSAAVTPLPSVTVKDFFGNNVSGVTVSFSVTPGSASVSGNIETGSNGIATVGSWTLSDIAGGTNILTVSTDGAPSVTFTTTTTASTAAPTISTITPAVGLNTGTLSGVVITGTHFSSTGGSVSLTKSGEENITGTCSRSTTSITCSFPLSDKEDGTWNVVVVNDDGKSVTKSGGFTILSESDSDVTITSISPVSAMAGDNVDFTIAGKDFVTAMNYEVYLYNSDYDNITADDVEVKTATSIKGTFDLDSDADVDTYQVCIKDSFGGIECKKNAFKITTNEVGSIEVSSSPTGATIYIDDVANGTTPRTIDDIIVGSYKITLKKTGYQDWAKMVKVEEDETTEVDGTLYAAATTTPTTARTAVPTTARTAAPRTTAKSTIKVPTTWADTPTTTAESPVDPVLIIGAICLAFIALRKH